MVEKEMLEQLIRESRRASTHRVRLARMLEQLLDESNIELDNKRQSQTQRIKEQRKDRKTWAGILISGAMGLAGILLALL